MREWQKSILHNKKKDDDYTLSRCFDPIPKNNAELAMQPIETKALVRNGKSLNLIWKDL